MKNANFLSLVSIENKKLWKRHSTFLLLIISVLMMVLITGVYRYYRQNTFANPPKSTVMADWQQKLTDSSTQYEQDIKRAEASTSFNDKNAIDKTERKLSQNNYRLENNLAPASSNIYDFWNLVGNCNVYPLTLLFIIIGIAPIVGAEYSDSTIKTMISRPFERWKLLTAKLIVSVLFTLLMMIVSYIAVVASVAAMFGTAGIGLPALLWIGGKTVAISGFAGSLLTTGLNTLTALVFVFLAFFLAVVTRSKVAATAVTVFISLSQDIFSLLTNNFSLGKYIYLSNEVNFSNFIVSGAPFAEITLPFALINAVVWTTGLTIIAYLTFSRRDIA